MLKAVFFDVYNTLARFWPPTEEIQESVGRRMGLPVTREGLVRGYAIADELFNSENSRTPLATRTPQERDAFFAEYERRILSGTGVEVSLEQALEVWREVSKVPKSLALFDDVLPALDSLKGLGLRMGVISNIRRDLLAQLEPSGLFVRLDVVVLSQEVGIQKPAPGIFLAALERAGVQSSEALYVGDQYQTDALGARAVGLHATLLDRRGAYLHVTDCSRTWGMAELVALVRDGAFASKRGLC